MNALNSPLDVFRLDGRVAVITGGARGIGLETAKLFLAAGAQVVVLDADPKANIAAALELEGKAQCVALDVSSEEQVNDVFMSLTAEHGRIDILVNNAGTALRKPTVELSLAEWQKVVDVNMTGVFLCARAAGATMLHQGGGGVMVNTASIFGLSGGGLYPNISYQATKGAVVNMTRALAMEWAPNGIRVNAVAPTWVDTDFIAALKSKPELMAEIERITPLKRLARPQEVAQAILFLASPASSMVTGHTLPVDGGFLAQ